MEKLKKVKSFFTAIPTIPGGHPVSMNNNQPPMNNDQPAMNYDQPAMNYNQPAMINNQSVMNYDHPAMTNDQSVMNCDDIVINCDQPSASKHIEESPQQVTDSAKDLNPFCTLTRSNFIKLHSMSNY